jgi:tetratricopeptide (TPR) repeat protein
MRSAISQDKGNTKVLRFIRYSKGGSCRSLAILIFPLLALAEPAWAVGKPISNEDVKKCYESSNPDVIIYYCTRAIQSRLSEKELARAFSNRGNAYNEKEDYDRAIQDYDQAIRLKPNHAPTFSNRGVAYGRKGDYDRAIQDYDQAIRLNPNNADAFSNRGAAYVRKGDYDRAIQDHDQAIRLNPDNANALYNRGNAYRRKGDYDRAIQNYNQAIRLNPNHALAFSNRGVVYVLKGDYDRAIQDYDRAIDLSPNNGNAFYNRANAYRWKEDYDRAIRDYDQAIRLNPNRANAFYSRGLVRFYLGQFPAAATDLSKAVQFGPPNLYRILFLYLAQARSGNSAQDNLSNATAGFDLEDWPGPIVSMYLGKAAERAVFDAAVDVDPKKQQEKKCQAYFYVGQQLLLQENKHEATKMFREAVGTNASGLFEYEGSRTELKRLGN